MTQNNHIPLVCGWYQLHLTLRGINEHNLELLRAAEHSFLDSSSHDPVFKPKPTMTPPAWLLSHALNCTMLSSNPSHTPTSSHQPAAISRCSLNRRSFLNIFIASFALPYRAHAVCGEPDPYFAHFTEWRENIVNMPDGSTLHYRLVGSRKNEIKTKKNPVLYIADPGVAISSGETLELLGGDRRVLFTDMLGVGESGSRGMSDASASQLLQQACIELRSAVKSAGFSKGTMLHIIAAGFGVQIAEALMNDLQQDGIGVLSVVAEGLGSVSDDVSFESLLGKRSCAVEGGEAGNLGIARVVYGDGANVNGTEEAVKRLSQRVTTMNLRTADYTYSSMKADRGMYVEKVINGNARLAHLANTEECLSVLDDFFIAVEQTQK